MTDTRSDHRTGFAPTATLVVLLLTAPAAIASDLAFDGEIEIPLNMVAGRPQVDVLINGKGPYPFVLDTGSSLNVLDAGVARELGLEVIGEREIGAPGMKQVPAAIVAASDLEVHGLTLADEELVTMDLAGMSGGIFLGVLRFGVFAQALVTLDLAAATLRLSHDSLDPGSADVISFNAEGGLIDIPIFIGGLEFTAHVDSGSPGKITVPGKLAEELSFIEEPVVMGEARLVGGRGTASMGKLDGDVKVGRLRFENPTVTILDLPIPKVNLGSRFLVDYLVQIDQTRGLIRFEPAEQPRLASSNAMPPSGGRRLGLRPKPGPPGPNGLHLVDEGLLVDWVEPDSLASEAGLRMGDLILSVNGTTLPEFDAASLVALLGSSDPLRMDVRRADSLEIEGVEIP